MSALYKLVRYLFKSSQLKAHSVFTLIAQTIFRAKYIIPSWYAMGQVSIEGIAYIC